MTRSTEVVKCPECGREVKKSGLKNHIRMSHEGDPRSFVAGGPRRGTSTAAESQDRGKTDENEAKPGWWDRPL